MTTPTILLVDDDPEVRETLAEVLEHEGYEVVTARDGLDAVERIRTGLNPAVILLDLMMPRMSGWEFLSAIRGGALASRTIIFSAVSDAIRITEVPVVLKGTPVTELLRTVQHRLPAQAPYP